MTIGFYRAQKDLELSGYGVSIRATRMREPCWIFDVSILHLIVVAVVQGLTEFLPISSSAHLILIPVVTAWPDQGPAIDIAVHLGTLGAVVLYLRREVSTIFAGIFDLLRGQVTDRARLFSLILIGGLPAIVVGYILVSHGYAVWLRSPTIIAWATIFFGILLWIADSRCLRFRQIGDLGYGAIIWIGLAQTIAFIPGASRSGITITAARGLGYQREDAARISLLLSIPVIVSAGGYQTLEVVQSAELALGMDALIACILAFSTALMAVALMMRWLRRASFLPFVVYRLLLGGVILIWIYV